jgi:hypothetical protein
VLTTGETGTGSLRKTFGADGIPIIFMAFFRYLAACCGVVHAYPNRFRLIAPFLPTAAKSLVNKVLGGEA